MSERDKKAWQQIKADPERYAAYLERKRKERAARKDYEAARKRKWRSANPDKAKLRRKAMNAVEVALRNGALIRPNICSDCMRIGEVEAHHCKGYAPEHWLAIRWLCVFCHRKADSLS